MSAPPSDGHKKVIYLVRHGQAEHNVSGDLTLRDPRLTELGRRQARLLDVSPLLAGAEVELVVASPLTRCLETAEIGFLGRSGPPPKFIAHPDAQETGAHPSDTGSERAELERRGFAATFELSLCSPKWYEKPAPFDVARFTMQPEGCAALRERLARLGAWLLARPETHIALVSHHGVFGHLPGLELELSNCEVVVAALDARGWTVRRASDELVLVLDGHSRQVTNYYGEKLSATVSTIRIVHGRCAAMLSEQFHAAGRDAAGKSVQAAATVESDAPGGDANAAEPRARTWRQTALLVASSLFAAGMILGAMGVIASRRAMVAASAEAPREGSSA